MKIFVIHYKKLINRKIFIISQFEKYNISDYEFIDIDRDELYNYNISMFQQNYDNSQIAILLSHFYAYKQINDKYDNGLILEDDAVLSDNFTDILNKYIIQLPKDYDMLFIGNGCNLHIENHKLISNQNIYEKCLYPTSWGGDGASRCVDSYIISKKCANKLCEYINNLEDKIKLPIDWWINVAARDNNFKVYWAEPTIVTQGTQNGLFTTSH
uniref:Glycosyl transferase family 25 domain-containing protein n=1 Tax=viral metagenome TaxID=1070528 RepID=A0A6C0HXH0_9ZZZZ